jgi:hypothetical protein
MNDVIRIKAVEPVIQGVLKIVWSDGYEGVVDLRPVIAKGRIFSYLEDPQHFRQVTIDEYGHSISWTNEHGEQIDFGAESLRAKAESRQP